MDYSVFRFDGKQKYDKHSVTPGDTHGIEDKEDGRKRLAKNREKIDALQSALYAEGKQALLVIFQAMDAAGKDGTIRHVFSGTNPQGIVVSSFKQPSDDALARDYLWRIHAAVPRRGMIGVFNRSHYEDVLVGRVLNLPAIQPLPERTLHDIWDRRYRQIRDFERHLHENGTTIVKFYLHLSPEEQKERFLARAKDPAKNWKFSQGDVDTSAQWDEYMRAYEKAINETAAEHAPWYVVPADHKWYTRAVVSQIVLDALRDMHPQYPKPNEEEHAEIVTYREEAGES